MRWLACRVTTGKEYDIRAKIKKIDALAEIWIPRRYYIEIVDRKVQDKSEKMLPGYILIGSETGINPYDVSSFLKPIGPVSEEEIAVLRAQEGQKKENLEVGSKILVIEGPFQGVKGNILKEVEESLECRLVFQGIDLTVNLRKDFVSVLK
jgi:transcription antitermination factor NusG